MFHIVDQVAATAVLTAAAAGNVTVPVVWLVMFSCLLVLIALIWAKRTWPFELFFAGLFFLLLGGTPMGRAFYDWLSTVGQG